MMKVDGPNDLKWTVPFTPTPSTFPTLNRSLSPRLASIIINSRNQTFKDVSSKLKIKNELVSEFDSREHLLECLVASCLVPGWAGHKSRIINGSHGSTEKD